MNQRPLCCGDPAPWFEARCTANPSFHLHSAAGRFIVLSFFRSSADPVSGRLLEEITANRHLFDDQDASFFGVSTDPDDERFGRVAQMVPGIRFFWDFDMRVSRLYGAADENVDLRKATHRYRRQTIVLDPRLRVLSVIPLDGSPEQHVARLIGLLKVIDVLGPELGRDAFAPVLMVPRVFEPELCQALIGHYERFGGRDSGFMLDDRGKTVEVTDYSLKRRRDQEIVDQNLRQLCLDRMAHRLLPELRKAFQFEATRLERYIVACYDSRVGARFRAHRDNTTKGTCHRRFVVSVNLNTGEYDGGGIRFPEFGRRLYQAPRGGALVFSGSLLHEATRVTHGRRYAFLPFLYDEPGAQIRQQNSKNLAGASVVGFT